MTDLERDVDHVVRALRSGEVVVIPTDTVYGLAADPTSESAMKRLFELKERPEGVPVAVLVASVAQAEELIALTPAVRNLVDVHWPGALTVVGHSVGAELHLGSVDTVGVRLPDHGLIRACAEAFGPIAATSANRHGMPTITDPTELVEAFGDDVAVIIDGGVLDGTASTVVDATVEPIEVLRQGVVHLDLQN